MLRIVLSIIILLLSTLVAGGQDKEVHDTLSRVVVRGRVEKPRNTTQTGMVRMDTKELLSKAVSFGTPDIVRSLQSLPGVSSGNELMSGMYVHGGDGTDNLFLLDGVPLYNISHFGGIFSSFNTDITDGVDFYKSGFPARYGGRLSSVVDVTTREGDMRKFHGLAALGMIDGRLQLEGPIVKDRTSFNIAYRRSWMDMMIALAKAIKNVKDSDIAYFMHDLNAGVTHHFAKDNTLRANFFYGADDMDLGLRNSNSEMDLNMKWGNILGSLDWSMKVRPGLRTNVCIFHSRSSSDTDYLLGMSKNRLEDTINSRIGNTGARAGLDWFPRPEHHIRAGLDLEAKAYRYKGQAPDKDSDAPRVSENAGEAGLFVEDEFFITGELTVNAGLRYSIYDNGGKFRHYAEPRAAVKWSPAYFMDVKLSYSRMTQGDHMVSSAYIDLPGNTWMPSTERICPVLSDQVSGGLYFKPDNGMTINLEGWYKDMKHLFMYNGPNAMFPPVQNWENHFTEGQGRSYGLEAEVSWSSRRISASAYYTLCWSERYFKDIYPFWFYDHNDNRHKINLVGAFKLTKKLEITANWNYHTGNRITLPSNVLQDGTLVYDEPYNVNLPGYHRLDLGLLFTKELRNSRRFETYVSIYNLFNNKNAFFALVSADEQGHVEGNAYSIIPIFPSVSISYKF